MQWYHYLIIIIAVVLGVLWGVSFYFIKTNKLDANKWALKSLGLPRGSVRALLAFLILFLLIFPAATGKPLPDLPQWLIGILGSIVGFYFGAAMAKKPPDRPSTDQ